MKKLLLVIDLQNDFINEKSRYVVDRINTLIDTKQYNNVVFTKFINNTESDWYKKLNYKGCMTPEGQDIPINTSNYLIIEKGIYSAMNNQLCDYLKVNLVDEIHLCGIDTECCVLKTAFDLFENKYNVKVLKDYCACTLGEERHNSALDIIRRNIGKDNVI